MSKIKAILFDLDGTLLPMNPDLFQEIYFKGLASVCLKFNLEAREFIKNMFSAINKMAYNNDRNLTNKEIFWTEMKKKIDLDIGKLDKAFTDYYLTDFDKVQVACPKNDKVVSLISCLKDKNIRLVVATNPFFPKVATLKRLSWAGLNSEDFELITYYENSYTIKPNLTYYQEILNKLNLNSDEVIMIGNDVDEDMIANKLGIKTFLITDCLINKNNVDISIYHHGNFDNLEKYLEQIL